ncbi:MAG: tetratricopeptide repeat protein [Acidobacteria bacterium]|nr:tetratricopeptide repeat protein [Acidobacteriota bacterium]
MAKAILQALFVILLGFSSALAQTLFPMNHDRDFTTAPFDELQILLPGGRIPQKPIPFVLARDGRGLGELFATDSRGHFHLWNLERNHSYTVTVPGDGTQFESTVMEISPEERGTIRLVLRAPILNAASAGGVISAKSASLPKGEAGRLYQKAMKEIGRQRPDAAEPLLRKATQLEPQFAAALTEMGVLLYRRKQYREAETMFRKALEADAEAFSAALYLGMSLNHQDRFSEAVEPLRNAVRHDPANALAHFHLGIALQETGDWQGAESELLRATAGPGQVVPAGKYFLGRLYALTGEWEKSIQHLNAFVKLSPESSYVPIARELLERVRNAAAVKK